MTDTDKDSQENIEKCFEEIKQVLKKYECGVWISEDGEIILFSVYGGSKYYSSKDFNE